MNVRSYYGSIKIELSICLAEALVNLPRLLFSLNIFHRYVFIKSLLCWWILFSLILYKIMLIGRQKWLNTPLWQRENKIVLTRNIPYLKVIPLSVWHDWISIKVKNARHQKFPKHPLPNSNASSFQSYLCISHVKLSCGFKNLNGSLSYPQTSFWRCICTVLLPVLIMFHVILYGIQTNLDKYSIFIYKKLLYKQQYSIFDFS